MVSATVFYFVCSLCVTLGLIAIFLWTGIQHKDEKLVENDFEIAKRQNIINAMVHQIESLKRDNQVLEDRLDRVVDVVNHKKGN